MGGPGMSAEGATALPARRTAGMSAPASGSDGGGSDGGGNPSPVPASSPPPVARTETELRLEAQLAAAREEQGAAEAELKRVLGAQGALLDRVRALDEAQRSSDATIEARIRAAHDAGEAAHERETALQKELKDANAALAEAKRNGGSDSGGGGGGNSGADGGDGAAVAAARAETEKYKARLAEVRAPLVRAPARASLARSLVVRASACVHPRVRACVRAWVSGGGGAHAHDHVHRSHGSIGRAPC